MTNWSGSRCTPVSNPNVHRLGVVGMRCAVVNFPGSASGTALTHEKVSEKGSKGFVFVNNRLEGNALETIGAMLAGLHGI